MITVVVVVVVVCLATVVVCDVTETVLQTTFWGQSQTCKLILNCRFEGQVSSYSINEFVFSILWHLINLLQSVGWLTYNLSVEHIPKLTIPAVAMLVTLVMPLVNVVVDNVASVVVVWEPLLQQRLVLYVELLMKTLSAVLIKGKVPWQQKAPLKSSKLVSLIENKIFNLILKKF